VDLSYETRRSAKRRKLTITVERDRRIVVNAPEGMSDEKIRQVVESKRQWIHEKIGHPKKYQRLAHPPGKELVSGESALYLGRLYRIEVIKDEAKEVQFVRCFLIPENVSGQRVEALREWYIGKAQEKIVPRVALYSHALGVDIAGVKIVDNRYRWGSCTLSDYISLNWRLIKAPMFVIDYVIVHELAHMIESNHTPKFWNIVRTHVGAMEKAKTWLKENGQLLEEAI
jgi:predicted metal-dependent hydrolase